MTEPMTRLDRIMVAWAAIGTVFWVAFAIGTRQVIPFAIYYPLWLGVAGVVGWRRRAALAARIRAMRLTGAARFIVLGYAAVLSEEVLAGLANHLPEGFSPVLLPVRVLQFQALNLFAFFGFVVGWYLLTRYVVFTRREVFYLAGVWGLYAEKIIFALPTQPAFVFLTAGPTILTYALIIAPALIGQDMGRARIRLHPLLRYPLAYLVLQVLSLPAVLAVLGLRAQLPWLFPPPGMVPP